MSLVVGLLSVIFDNLTETEPYPWHNWILTISFVSRKDGLLDGSLCCLHRKVIDRHPLSNWLFSWTICVFVNLGYYCITIVYCITNWIYFFGSMYKSLRASHHTNIRTEGKSYHPTCHNLFYVTYKKSTVLFCSTIKGRHLYASIKNGNIGLWHQIKILCQTLIGEFFPYH